MCVYEFLNASFQTPDDTERANLHEIFLTYFACHKHDARSVNNTYPRRLVARSALVTSELSKGSHMSRRMITRRRKEEKIRSVIWLLASSVTWASAREIREEHERIETDDGEHWSGKFGNHRKRLLLQFCFSMIKRCLKIRVV